MARAQTWRQFGDGPLSRITSRVYILLVVELLLLLTTLPGLLPLLLLGRDASNLPLAAVCLLPVGPALSAALYALHHQRPDLTDLRPPPCSGAATGPTCPACCALGADAAVADRPRREPRLPRRGRPPGWWAVPLVLIAVAVTLWAANALVITSLFDFRTRDVLRLAVHFLIRTPGVAVGNALLLAAAAGITAVSSEAVLALLGSVAVLAFLRISHPMIDLIRKEFTA